MKIDCSTGAIGTGEALAGADPAIMPGLIHAPHFDTLSPEARQSLEAQVPFPSRLGEPDEYAKMAGHFVGNDMKIGFAIRLDDAIRLAPR